MSISNGFQGITGVSDASSNRTTPVGQPTLSFGGNRAEVELTERLNKINNSMPLDISNIKDGDFFKGMAFVRKTIKRASDQEYNNYNIEFQLVDTSGNMFQSIKYNPEHPEALMDTQSKTVMVEGTAKEYRGKIYYRLNTIILFNEQYPLSYFMKSLDNVATERHSGEVLTQINKLTSYSTILGSVNINSFMEFLRTYPIKGAIGNAVKQINTALKIIDTIYTDSTDERVQTIKFLIFMELYNEYHYGEFTEMKILPISIHQAIENSSFSNEKKMKLTSAMSKERNQEYDLAIDALKFAYRSL